MRKILFLFFTISLLPEAKAQLSLGYYPFNNTLSITSNTEKRIWVDGRLETNTFYGNINPEIFAMFNLKRTGFYNIYTGLSCKSVLMDGFVDGDFIGGYSLSVGSRIKPFRRQNNVHFMFELSPYVNKEFNSGILRAYLGVAYHFRGLKKVVPHND